MRNAERDQKRAGSLPTMLLTCVPLQPATASAKSANDRLTQCRGFLKRTSNPKLKFSVVTTIRITSRSTSLGYLPFQNEHRVGSTHCMSVN